jgi:hypothetical protein
MKRIVLFLGLFLFASAAARAEWSDVKEGYDADTVLALVGNPLMIVRSKTGAQVVWTYDNGAYILFENGRVSYWQPPQPKRKSCPKSEAKA